MRATLCTNCGKARSRHHVARSDGYTFLRCFTRSEVRAGSPITYYDDFDPCPQGDPDCETGDDGSCHDGCTVGGQSDG